MKKMLAARIGMVFDPQNKLNELSLHLPKDAEILSVSITENNDNDYVLLVRFLSPAEAYDTRFTSNYPWKDFHFFIVKCAYTEIEIDEHKYIGNIDIGDDTYVVFYK